MSRALARLSVGRGGPRDLAGLRDGILAADQALARLSELDHPPQEIADVMEALRRPSRELAREFDARAGRATAADQARRRLRARGL